MNQRSAAQLTQSWSLVSGDLCAERPLVTVTPARRTPPHGDPTGWDAAARDVARDIERDALEDAELASVLGWQPIYADVSWTTCVPTGTCTFSVYLSS